MTDTHAAWVLAGQLAHALGLPGSDVLPAWGMAALGNPDATVYDVWPGDRRAAVLAWLRDHPTVRYEAGRTVFEFCGEDVRQFDFAQAVLCS